MTLGTWGTQETSVPALPGLTWQPRLTGIYDGLDTVFSALPGLAHFALTLSLESGLLSSPFTEEAK